MTPTSSLELQIANLLAQDTTTIDAVLRPKVHLAINSFVPSPTRVLADFTEATFTSYAALLEGTGTPEVFTDPATGNVIVQLIEPVGGWHWTTGDAVGLPQTVYGFYVTDNAGAVLYGCELLPKPVILTAGGQGVDLPWARFNNVGGGVF